MKDHHSQPKKYHASFYHERDADNVHTPKLKVSVNLSDKPGTETFTLLVQANCSA